MDARIVSFSITTFLHTLRARLEEAQGLATAADACAGVGQTARAVELANDADALINDAETLLGMAAGLVRYSRTADADHSAGDATTESEPAPAAPVDASFAAETVRVFLHQARHRLDKAVSVAKAAEILAAAGQPEDGARFALDAEPLLYEAKHFINTASLVNRLSVESGAPGSS